jgi:sensor histidine kinase regulating citrate/malate metabolism
MTIAAADSLDRVSPPQDRNVLWIRIGFLLLCIIAFVLFLTAFLNYSNCRKTYLELNQNRYLVTANDLRQAIVLGLNIGLNPSENAHLRPIMKEFLHRQVGIRYISIVSDSGNAITEGTPSDEAVRDWNRWFEKVGPEESWHTSDVDTFQIGVPFLNNFNGKIGAVVIGYDRTAIEDGIDDMGSTLLIDAITTLSLFAILTFSGVYFLTSEFVRKIAQIGQAIDSTLIAAKPIHVHDDLLDAETAKDINEFTQKTHYVVQKIVHLERLVADGKNEPSESL